MSNSLDVIKKVVKHYQDLKSDKNGRYLSWEHCYKVFHDAREHKKVDIDNLSLHLAFYLASWGMYRGSSFLLKKDYRIHKGAVEILLDKKYDVLFGIDIRVLEENLNLMFDDLLPRIIKYYEPIRDEVAGKNQKIEAKLSNTLVTKILMGTLGCVPAYDRYFIDGVKRTNVATGNFNRNSIKMLIDYYKDNYDELETERQKMKVYSLQYPQMKLIDMVFWQIGSDKIGSDNKSEK